MKVLDDLRIDSAAKDGRNRCRVSIGLVQPLDLGMGSRLDVAGKAFCMPACGEMLDEQRDPTRALDELGHQIGFDRIVAAQLGHQRQ